jgi:hypothetical protein
MESGQYTAISMEITPIREGISGLLLMRYLFRDLPFMSMIEMILIKQSKVNHQSKGKACTSSVKLPERRKKDRN